MVARYATVHTDCWSPYLVLGNLGFNHRAVNHSDSLACPLTGAHTNTIEGLWALVKRKMKRMMESITNICMSLLFVVYIKTHQ